MDDFLYIQMNFIVKHFIMHMPQLFYKPPPFDIVKVTQPFVIAQFDQQPKIFTSLNLL